MSARRVTEQTPANRDDAARLTLAAEPDDPLVITGTTLLPCDEATAWAALTDFPSFPKWSPLLRAVRIVRQSKDVTRCFFDGAFGYGPLKIAVRFEVDMTMEPKRRIVMTRYHGGDFDELRFEHNIRPVRGGTELKSSYLFDLRSLSVLGMNPFKTRPWAVRPVQCGMVALMLNGLAEYISNEYPAARAAG